MFVRVKRIGGRRYVYIVEGVRDGRRVRQRTLCYLGPLPRVVVGMPDDVGRAARFRVGRAELIRQVLRIPLTFEELCEVRRAQYSLALKTRSQGPRTRGNLPRVKGELSALSKLARSRFEEIFETVGERAYRMR